MFLGTRPASGTRIGTATWPYNALLVEVQPNSRKSACRKFHEIGTVLGNAFLITGRMGNGDAARRLLFVSSPSLANRKLCGYRREISCTLVAQNGAEHRHAVRT